MSPRPKLTEQQENTLYDRLIRLGDMMGDGLHHEPDGKWISKEYGQIVRTLGIVPPKDRGPSIARIDERMKERVAAVKCTCGEGRLVQVRSGSRRAQCTECGAKWQLLKAASR
jgi:hypothetical protein